MEILKESSIILDNKKRQYRLCEILDNHKINHGYTVFLILISFNERMRKIIPLEELKEFINLDGSKIDVGGIRKSIDDSVNNFVG